MATYAAFIAFLLVRRVWSYCPNSCSLHGTCSEPDFVCSCYPEYTGGDCSLRTCPVGIAWADVTTDIDTAHAVVECSNRGICQRSTGRCQCDNGFFGASCDKIRCPSDCGSHGRCLSIKTATRVLDHELLGIEYNLWDAEKIFGCVCDKNYFGYDCSLRACEEGVNPSSVQVGVEEVQILTCDATSGQFTLSFMGETTRPIPYLASIETFSETVKQIQGLETADIVFSEVAGAVCAQEYSQVVQIIFQNSLGSDNKIISSTRVTPTCETEQTTLCGGTGITFAYKGNTLTSSSQGAVASVQGTLEYEFCSGRGKCETLTGQCSCFDSYALSADNAYELLTGNCDLTIEPTHCPTDEASCSGHGYCSGPPYFECTCFQQWSGPDCSQRVCPKAKSWFDKPSSTNVAHELATCSNRGTCDHRTGKCICEENFEGSACQLLKCPITQGQVCSGHGTCLTMEGLALLGNPDDLFTYGSNPNNPATWDRRKIQGCFCDDGYIGYDCSLQQCIFGDNPDTAIEDHVECSNQGNCDRDKGICVCFPGYSASNGSNNVGQIGDCGYKTPYV